MSEVAVKAMPRRGRLWVILILALALGGLGYAIVSISTQKAGHAIVHVAGIAEAQEIFGGVPQEGDRLGSSDAPVTIQIFNDLQCSSCREDFLSTIPGLTENYARPGDVQAALPPLLDQRKPGRGPASTAPRRRPNRATAGSTPTSSSATRTKPNASARRIDLRPRPGLPRLDRRWRRGTQLPGMEGRPGRKRRPRRRRSPSGSKATRNSAPTSASASARPRSSPGRTAPRRSRMAPRWANRTGDRAVE